MTFVRSASPAYFAPASINTLSADGQLIVSNFDCQFRRLKRTELAALRREVEQQSSDVMMAIRTRIEGLAAAPAQPTPPAAPEDADGVEKMLSRQMLVRVMVGWRAVEAPTGGELPFSFDELDRTEEEFPGFINACANSFWASCDPKASAHLAKS